MLPWSLRSFHESRLISAHQFHTLAQRCRCIDHKKYKTSHDLTSTPLRILLRSFQRLTETSQYHQTLAKPGAQIFAYFTKAFKHLLYERLWLVLSIILYGHHTQQMCTPAMLAKSRTEAA